MWIEFDILKITTTLAILSLLCTCTNCRSTVNDQRSSMESNSIQRTIIENRDSRALKRVFLSNRTITCNDGSQAGFYLRKSATTSKRWVVFLEGGWHCYDQKSCRARWMRLRHLMTSAQWPETRNVGGILSPLSAENPYWHDANHVFVPYCSSDSWSGTKIKADTRDGWRFMGSLIVKQVIADLIPLGLGNIKGAELLLAGSSAGGLGVMLNLDKVKKFLHDVKGVRVKVKGVSDSGWFLDREPYETGAVAASEAVRQGWKLWHGALPDACVAQHSKEPWRCYFGHRLYSTLKAPLFVFQWLFDEAQMRADSVGAPVTPQQWNYIHDMGGALRASLDNVTAVFAPSCIGHSVLTKRDWLDIKIDDISLAEALRCWEKPGRFNRQSMRRNAEGEDLKEEKRRKKKKQERKRKQEERARKIKERELRKLERKNKELARRGNHTTQTPSGSTRPERSSLKLKSNNNNNRYDGINGNFNQNQSLIIEQQIKKRKNSTRHQQTNRNVSNQNKKNNNRHKSFREPRKCSLRLLEKCSWPQCNYSCPSLTNPKTGEEMRFLELLASFGLDIEAVATALGVDMTTLNNMDHTELVNLLTQQVS